MSPALPSSRRPYDRPSVMRIGALLVIALTAAGIASVGASASAVPQRFTLYAVSQKEQFVNNADDRARGQGKNPFGNYFNGFTPVSSSEKTLGPFPGDEGMYAFTVYSTPDLKTVAGSGVFICQYNFDKNGFCDAAYQLKDGTLVGKGAFNFSASSFNLAVIGGTYGYRGARGDLSVSVLPSRTQRLAFTVQYS